MSKYNQRKGLNLSAIASSVLEEWSENKTFEKSVSSRENGPSFVFYEGPPSSNGLPGIHHVMARTIKDVFCRYKTLKGYKVNRKAGWDTHGLPVELGVEKELGITKEDIGKSISIEEYNEACKSAVMRYTDVWNDLTHKMGYWVDTKNPYVTYENKYIESVWWLLKEAFKKGLIYKGYTVQPYSPMAGTGLSSHEINQPGCYKNVKDTSITAQFLLENNDAEFFKTKNKIYFLAWTTTPWTLPSNTALAVNKRVEYVVVETKNQYTNEPMSVVLAEKLVSKVFSAPYTISDKVDEGKKQIFYKIVQKLKGSDLEGLEYKQLMPLALPVENPEKAFKIIHGDFVSTDDGTGIVHIAPTFGADDAKVAKDAGVPPMLVKNKSGDLVPLVNLKGAFIDGLGELSGKFVKNEYYKNIEKNTKSVDVEIAIQLKEQNKAFKVEKYEHSYPHCWRTDKPVLYYPLDSWFIKVSAFKKDMVTLNNSVNWKPASTGSGRFGNWLENANDWNLSRSRFWGIPIPIWRSEDAKEVLCIGSVEELKKEISHSIKMGNMDHNPLESFLSNDFSEKNYKFFDLHKSYVDKLVLSSKNGTPLYREADLIDVWFDSGSMPFAQWHYPFENKALIDNNEAFPADFIAEGVDQTRGWFYTLHAIATMTKKSVAYKNVVSNGLVLDKNGQKMSKRLGNAVDPFKTLEKYGADATRWYMISNSQPWDNLKFDLQGIEEVTRKFFGTLSNTYSFFALYANLDNYSYSENNFSNSLSEIDLWILSKVNSLNLQVDTAYQEYEPTKAARLIQSFVIDDLSNWYVRLCRKRFWVGEFSEDKKAAYDTLFTCLKSVCVFMAPIAPFYSDFLFKDLGEKESVHLTNFLSPKTDLIDQSLEEKMSLAQKVSSLILSLRKRTQIKVRQPLQRVLIPTLNSNFENAIKSVKNIITNEVNVKSIEFISSDDSLLKKKAKANFKVLGPKHGKNMKEIAAAVSKWTNEEIAFFEKNNGSSIVLENKEIKLSLEDVEITTADVPGWEIATNGTITVALDISLTNELKEEGVSRDFVNKVQNKRKELGLEVSDFIKILVCAAPETKNAINNNLNYICSETLTKTLDFVENINGDSVFVDDDIKYVIEKLK
ncbi:MAG: isoleucine--tRNA ligase [Flavobacteriales bacterium]|nr:isoleucine--tRNA ligase [Flavobacteriales bacterium]